MGKDIVNVNIEISIPKLKWMAKLNEKFPELNFFILSNFLSDENTGNTLYQITGPDVKRFLSEFNLISNPPFLQVLFEASDLLFINVKTKDPWILSALIKSELLFFYPIIIKNGKINIESITERIKFDMFLTELEAKNIKYRVISVGYYQKTALLTRKQKEILQIIYKQGFFNIPRGKSLSEIAIQLKISPSALSETIRRLNRRLAKNYLDNIV